MKKILKTIACCLGALAIAFTAFFVPNINKSASADSVPQQRFVFYSDTFVNPGSKAFSSTSQGWNDYADAYSVVSNSFSISSDQFSLTSYKLSFTINCYIWDRTTFTTGSFNDYYFRSNSTSYVEFNVRDTSTSSVFYNRIGFILVPVQDEIPTLNMQSLEYGNYASFVGSVASDYFGSGFSWPFGSTSRCQIISYTDTAGWKYIFVISSRNDFNDTNSQPYTKYYNLTEVNFTDNQYYQEGYNQGYNSGLDVGQSSGYSDGYNSGYNVGFGNGRNEGIQNANNYSFLGLFGAMIDAPLTGLRSLFNFEFLGINLLSFITSLLTIALITFVIKKLMGR